jgi:hypothetical protein
VRPIVDIIQAKAATLGHILPRSSLGRALAYMRKYWEGLTVFLTDADVPMHSNDIERAMRGPAVGRKNHYGSRNITTANVAAVWYRRRRDMQALPCRAPRLPDRNPVGDFAEEAVARFR